MWLISNVHAIYNSKHGVRASPFFGMDIRAVHLWCKNVHFGAGFGVRLVNALEFAKRNEQLL